MNTDPSTEPIVDLDPLLADNEPITKYSARVIRRQILADGHVSKAERKFLRDALDHGNLLDDESFHILLELLLTGNRVQ